MQKLRIMTKLSNPEKGQEGKAIKTTARVERSTNIRSNLPIKSRHNEVRSYKSVRKQSKKIVTLNRKYKENPTFSLRSELFFFFFFLNLFFLFCLSSSIDFAAPSPPSFRFSFVWPGSCQSPKSARRFPLNPPIKKRNVVGRESIWHSSRGTLPRGLCAR